MKIKYSNVLSIQTGAAMGMQSMDQALLALVEKGIINRDEAKKAVDPSKF